jgi:hypothetical protein
MFHIGCTNVTCTATDNSGNICSCTFTVCTVDTTPPTVTCPNDITVDSPNGTPMSVPYAVTCLDNCGIRSLDCTPSGSTFPCGTTTVTCTCTDNAGLQGRCSFHITVRCPNEPPVCNVRVEPAACGMTFPNIDSESVIALDDSTACVILDGSASSDPDNDPLTFTWSVDGTNVATGPVVTNCLSRGCHTITLTVSDGQASSSCESRICVITACEAVEQCITLVNNTPIARKNKRPLIASLKAACASFDRGNFTSGMNQLEAFQHKVNAQVGRSDPAAAAAFNACAQRIIDAIDCAAHHGNHGGGNGH